MFAPEQTFGRARRLRREMSLLEVVLWQHLRGEQLAGLRFRRQHPIGPYILDFCCAEHDNPERAARDERRTVWLTENGIRILRFPAADVLNDRHLEGLLQMIALAAAPSTAVPAVPLPRFAGKDQEE